MEKYGSLLFNEIIKFISKVMECLIQKNQLMNKKKHNQNNKNEIFVIF